MTALVLVHAFPLDHRMWDLVAAPIAAQGWQIHLPDLRGCGEAADWEGEPTLNVCASDLVGMLDRYGIDKAVFGGCSLGGYVVMELLRTAPERVAGCIFIDTKAGADTDEGRANRLRVADQVEAAGSTEALWRAMLPNVVADSTHATRPDVVNRVQEMMSQSRPDGVAALQRAMAARPDSIKAISEFRGPVLSIRGAEDKIASADDHAAITAAAQDGMHIEIADCGHLAPLEAPVETATAIIDFLDGVRRASC